ncbi:hypothetical protein V5O48_002667 [Marasmius crinis-equi]|uniref:Zn(2)-C6 fungal-type domain-containing protein n=1 Tax=Marasmius crinis-equi TaxID=585013 RepID=A0ABR3FUZ5_9AGAR
MTGQISTSTSGAEKTVRKFIFKQPIQQLRRGKACLCCRLHKIKCDAVKPVCGPCVRAPKEDECSYTDHPTRTKILEQSVARLQARVRELEGSGSSNSNSSSEGELVEPVDISQTMAVPPYPSNFGSSDSLFIPSTEGSQDLFSAGFDAISLEILPEPSSSVIETLLDTFLPNSTHFGFFLHLERFRASALLPLPFGDPGRPAPALLSVTYLWGIHLSQDALYKSYESIFLQRALNNISTEADYSRIIHTIQAQVLIAVYFFRTNRFLEADIHINSAISLCLSSGLHKLRSCRPFTPTVLGVFGGREAYLTAPQDLIEEGERISAFWTVFSIHRNLGVALGMASGSFGILEDPDTQIDTPWPMGMEDYERGSYIPDITGFRTIEGFLRMENIETYSNTPSYFKGVVLLQKAFCLCRRFRAGLASSELDSFTANCNTLERSISQFQATLPPIDDGSSNNTGSDGSPSQSSSFNAEQHERLAMTYALTVCAYLKIQTIFFHCGSLQARTRALSVAHSIIQLVRDNLNPGSVYLNPILGTICLVACQTFADDLERLRSKGQGEALGLGLQGLMSVSVAQEQDKIGLETTIQAALSEGFKTMSLLSVKCPLAGMEALTGVSEYQFKKFQEVYKYTGAHEYCHPGQYSATVPNL